MPIKSQRRWEINFKIKKTEAEPLLRSTPMKMELSVYFETSERKAQTRGDYQKTQYDRTTIVCFTY